MQRCKDGPDAGAKPGNDSGLRKIRRSGQVGPAERGDAGEGDPGAVGQAEQRIAAADLRAGQNAAYHIAIEADQRDFIAALHGSVEVVDQRRAGQAAPEDEQVGTRAAVQGLTLEHIENIL